MNILITNDDGYQSKGLKILADRLSKEHKVFIVAPDSNRSAVSNHITMFSENRLVQKADNLWANSGYPADCCFIGSAGNLYEDKIDVVVAGINYGPNLGTDIIYSGTCAAAREAVIHGKPGIAVSVDPINWEKTNKEGFKFEALADFVAKNLKTLMELTKLDFPRAFVNVNGASLDKYEGVVFTDKLVQREYNDAVDISPVEGEADTFKTKFLPGNGAEKATTPEDSDCGVVRKGCISVSRVYADPLSAGVVDGITFSL